MIYLRQTFSRIGEAKPIDKQVKDTKIAMRSDQDLVAADAAVGFARSFYSTLQNGRDNIDSFKNYYCAADAAPNGTNVPSIVWNGNQITSVDAMFDLFSVSMPPTFYDVQTVDAHVLNPKHFADLSAERNFSMMVTIGGYLRLEDSHNGPLHEFSETLVLVPNRAKLMGRGAQQGKRDFLIQNEVFRFVVSHDPIQIAGWTSMDVDDMT